VLVYLGKNIRTPKTCAIGKDNDLVTKEKSLLFGNKKSVRPVIVSMKGGSQMTITSPTPARPASEKQVAFLKTLISERANDLVVDFATLTSKQASDLIGSLISAPRNNAPVAEGMYRNANGVIYKVQASRETGNLYAKVLDVAERKFIYEQGAMRGLTAEMRMTIEEAKAFGVEYGFCVWCGKFLTDPVSVAQGIGPVCAGRV
jgi:hypothetical protein